MKKIVLLNSVIMFFQSCNKNSLEPEQDNSIAVFIAGQNLLKPQPYKIVYANHNGNFALFHFLFGEAFDCPAGCAYNSAYGLRYKGKIGWLYIEGLNEQEKILTTYYDVDSTDEYLFSGELWNNLEQKNYWVFHTAFLPLIAGDKDTPVNILNVIAQSLYSFISTYIGKSLLNNPKVITNKNILTILSNLPYNAYPEVRNKAKELLENLGP